MMVLSSSGSPDTRTDAKAKKHTHSDYFAGDAADPHGSENGQGSSDRPSVFVEDVSAEKSEASRHQGPLAKSLQRAEALLRNLNPGLKRLMGQKSKEHSWDSESESTSTPSKSIPRLARALRNLDSQCHVVREPGGRTRSYVVSSPSEREFHHQPQNAAVCEHHAQLRRLMEQRALLMFLQEFAKRLQASRCFVERLETLLEKTRSGLEPWNVALRGVCQESVEHLEHWDGLWASARSEPLLHGPLCSRMQTLASMRQTLQLSGLRVMELMDGCISAAFSACCAAQLERVDVLVDLLCAVQMYNQAVEGRRGRVRHSGPKTFPVEGLLKVLAGHQASKAAGLVYTWTSEQSHLLCLLKSPSELKTHLEITKLNGRLLSPTVQPQSGHGEPPKRLHKLRPLSSFMSQDGERLGVFCQALQDSSHLLASRLSSASGRDGPTEDCVKFRRSAVSSRSSLMALSKPDACSELSSAYKKLLWREFGKEVVRHFRHQPYHSVLGSIHHWNHEMLMLLVTWLKHKDTEDLIPEEGKEAWWDLCCGISSSSAFTQWDEVMCSSLGSGLKEKCVPEHTQPGCDVRTATMDLTLQLFPPLHDVLALLQTHTQPEPGAGLQRHVLGVMSRSVASVQTSSFWVVSKAQQFLASWSLSRFLLVTQGDLKDLEAAVESLLELIGLVTGDSPQPGISQQAASLAQALARLRVFSDSVLRVFSLDCKKMSVEIFQQTMPSAKHWRISCRSELPSNPSGYAASAAQSVIGPVLESVRPLPDHARAAALTEATTAFMEAWMEHILTQKIKFSVPGALQLKQDFDLIRQLIGSEQYSLSQELNQKLLSLRVFHQVDNAVVCLLQQPMARSYLPSRAWEPFRRCCPNSAQVMDQASGSLNNLESMDVPTLPRPALTPPSTPPQSYLAAAQQEWLELRVSAGSRWRLPLLHCFSRSEP